MRPKREHATKNQQTYMVTATTWERRGGFRNERLIDVLYHYRGSAFLLHKFVIMPDHVHILVTLTSLEKAVQLIKGGFSYRAKKELRSNMAIWQIGFEDHRIRDFAAAGAAKAAPFQNTVKKASVPTKSEGPTTEGQRRNFHAQTH